MSKEARLQTAALGLVVLILLSSAMTGMVAAGPTSTSGPVSVQCDEDVGSTIRAAATWADVDGDSNDEVFFGTNDGTLYSYDVTDSGCSERWNYTVSNGKIAGSIAVGDANGNGNLEVYFGDSDASNSEPSQYALDAENGTVLASDGGVPVLSGGPTLYDVDSDSNPELIYSYASQYLAPFDFDGSTHTKPWFYSTMYSNSNEGTTDVIPAVRDLDGDGSVEMVTVSAASSSDDGSIAAVNSDGSKHWEYDVGHRVRVSPRVGDVDNDGNPEVVVTDKNVSGGRPHVWIINHDGTLNKKIDLPENDGSATGQGVGDSPYPGPVIADVDQDGTQEIIFGSHDDILRIVDGEAGTIEHTYDNTPGQDNPYNNDGNFESMPAVSDIDGDGGYEIIIGTNANKTLVLNETLSVEAEFTENRTDISGEGGDPDFEAGPALADADNDDRMEIAIGSFSGHFFVLEYTEDGGTPEWPQGYARSSVETDEVGLLNTSRFPPAAVAIGLWEIDRTTKDSTSSQSELTPGDTISAFDGGVEEWKLEAGGPPGSTVVMNLSRSDTGTAFMTKNMTEVAAGSGSYNHFNGTLAAADMTGTDFGPNESIGLTVTIHEAGQPDDNKSYSVTFETGPNRTNEAIDDGDVAVDDKADLDEPFLDLPFLTGQSDIGLDEQPYSGDGTVSITLTNGSVAETFNGSADSAERGDVIYAHATRLECDGELEPVTVYKLERPDDVDTDSNTAVFDPDVGGHPQLVIHPGASCDGASTVSIDTAGNAGLGQQASVYGWVTVLVGDLSVTSILSGMGAAGFHFLA